MKWRQVVVVSFVLLGPASVSAQEPTFEGCYDFDIDVWNAPAASDSVWWATRIRLSSDPGQGLFNTEQDLAVAVVPGAMPDRHPWSWWRPLGADSIAVTWSNGFTGFTVRLIGEPGANLRGTAEAFTDEFPSEPFTARATASPVACDAAIEAERQLRHTYPRHIVLSTGDSIVLRDSVPRHLRLESIDDVAAQPASTNVRRRVRLIAEAAGLFRGATSIDLHTGWSGRIGRIELHYPDSVSFDALQDRLTAELGPPSTHEGAWARMAIWGAWTEDIALVQRLQRAADLTINISSHY